MAMANTGSWLISSYLCWEDCVDSHLKACNIANACMDSNHCVDRELMTMYENRILVPLTLIIY